MSRFSDILIDTPPITFGLISVCVGIFFIQNAFALDLHLFTMCPRLVIYMHELYRIIFSALFHANLMHLGMNMLSTFAISSLLEKKLGTLRFLFSVVSAMIFSGILYCTISWSAYKILGYEDFMYEHAVGFSGVIFHMSVLECSLSPNVSRNIFGFFSIPPFLYPWALLILLQMFLPNLSFLGHLSGIITGTLQSYGLFEFVIPGESYTSQMESLEVLRRLVNLPSFVSTPNSSRFLYQRETGGIFKFIKRGCAFMMKLFKDVWETLFVCIFGRGSSLNSNIQIFGRGTMHADGPGKISYPTDIIEEASDDERDPLSILV